MMNDLITVSYTHLKSEAGQQREAKERYEKEQQEIEENIEKLTRQSNDSEDEIKRCQAQISKASRELDLSLIHI